MKPTKNCIEWFERIGYALINYRDGQDSSDYYVFNNLASNIVAKNAQEIYNQVQKKKIELIDDILIDFVLGLPTGEIETWKLLKYCNEFTRKLKTKIKELENETKEL